MGRRRANRSRGRDLQEVIARAVRAGYEEGMGRALRAALETRAMDLLIQDYGEAESIYRGQGFGRALPAIEQARAKWAARWEGEMRNLLARIYEEVTAPAEEVLGVRFSPESPAMRQHLDARLSELAESVTRTTVEDISRILTKGEEDEKPVQEVGSLITSHTEEASRSRAKTIAATELQAGKNGAALAQAQASGVVINKTWNSKPDAREEHKRLRGTSVGINEPFPNGLMHPNEPNCRCWLTFGIDRQALQARQRGAA